MSLLFGMGGGYLGYMLGKSADTTVVIENPVPETPIGENQYYDAIVDVVNHVGPAVVAISVEKLELVQSTTSDFFGGLFNFSPYEGSQPRYAISSVAGSGVIIKNEWTDEEGYIVTNNHVVEGDVQKLTVTLKDKRTFEAKVVATDPMSDLAVLKINAKGLPTVEIGDSSKVKVGQTVVAIGNPYEFDHTVTTGVISATERTITVQEESSGGYNQSGTTTSTLWGAIQTDAAINPGNSGGALVTLDNKLVGINTIKRYGDNLGFAVSSNIVRRVVSELIKYGKVTWPFLGVSGTTMSPEIAQKIEKPELADVKGAIIGRISHGPARDAGLIVLDIITKINDTEITTMDELLAEIRKHDVGEEIDLTVNRDGKIMNFKAVLKPYPDYDLQ